MWDNTLPDDAGSHSVPFEIHRCKGRLELSNGEVKVIQGVRELFEIFDSPSPGRDKEESAQGKMVLIGRHLEDFDFKASLLAALR